MEPILINGEWQQSHGTNSFQAYNPTSDVALDTVYPVSNWEDIDRVLTSASEAFIGMRDVDSTKLAEFIERFANRIEDRSTEICEIAFQETGLPVSPRLADVELPRTTNQLRLAAKAVRESRWQKPTLDTVTGIRSMHAGIGPVAVFGPNNFPLAFGSVSGGDFAAALAAGNPVIAKANSSHPGTTRILAEEANHASHEFKMPPGLIQMIYRTSHQDGEKMVADPRLASVGYTGSRNAGLKLKRVADEHGKPIYLELSSINPVFILPGAIEERGEPIATELAGSCLLGTGQFCTSPGLIVIHDNSASNEFVNYFVKQVQGSANGVLLSSSVKSTLEAAVQQLTTAGAEKLCGGAPDDSTGIRFQNTVLKISGDDFVKNADVFQTEAFGNASLIVTVRNTDQAIEVAKNLEGNLTGTVYAHTGSNDDADYDAIAPWLRQKVGRLLNDKMPTGVAVSSAMNHGGPFPATGHPAFTAVGMPESIYRFSMLQCFDNVRQHRLPDILKDENPRGIVRLVDGEWTTASVQLATM